jgi:nitroreductase
VAGSAGWLTANGGWLAGRAGWRSDLGPMQTWEAITSRRDVRAFADRPIAVADLDQILEAARRTPSSRNSQPWDFVVVTDRSQLEQLSTVWVGAAHVAGSAATIALIIDDSGEAARRVQFDLGQVTMAIMLAAADLGIGSGHSSVGELDLARQLLRLPAGKSCEFLISLGYPAGRPLAPIKTPDRRPFDDVVHRGHW